MQFPMRSRKAAVARVRLTGMEPERLQSATPKAGTVVSVGTWIQYMHRWRREASGHRIQH